MNADQDKIKITPCSNGWIVRVKATDYYDEFVFMEWDQVEYFLRKQLQISLLQISLSDDTQTH